MKQFFHNAFPRQKVLEMEHGKKEDNNHLGIPGLQYSENNKIPVYTLSPLPFTPFGILGSNRSQQSHCSVNARIHSQLQQHIKRLLEKVLPIIFINFPQKHSIDLRAKTC